MTHVESEQLLAAGAVLDDLSPGERDAYDAHRAACVACRRLEVELDDVLADLALVVPDRMPPPDLLIGIRRAIGAEAEAAASGRASVGQARPAVVAGGAPAPDHAPGVTTAGVISLADARERRASRLPLIASIGIAAAFALVAVGLGVRVTGLQRDLDAASAQVASLGSTVASQSSAMTVAMTPGHVTVALHPEPVAPAAHAAVMYVPGSTAAYIIAQDLPPTPPGSGYQLWYADASGVHGLQTVSFDGRGAFVAPLGVDLAGGTAVMITLEPAGGATGEPGPQVVFGEL